MRRCTGTTCEAPIYLHGDHLGSASLATDAAGRVVSEMRYTPYGEVRSGALPTDRRYTGQRWEAGTGLYDYNARYYDPALGRFIQADTIISDPANPQDLNRYSYARNNPLGYVDPDGHIAIAVAIILLAAGGGFIGNWGYQVAQNADQGMGFWRATSHQNVDLGRSAQTAAAAGGIAATVVAAAPVAVATAGQALMGAGMATGSTALWTAGTSTVAAGAGLYGALWVPSNAQQSSLPALSALEGGKLAHRQLGQDYLNGVPTEQRTYVDVDQTFTNPTTGKHFRPDVVNHWTGEVVEFKPQSWNDGGPLTYRAQTQLDGYLNGLNALYKDWRLSEGLPPYVGKINSYDPLKYYAPQ